MDVQIVKKNERVSFIRSSSFTASQKATTLAASCRSHVRVVPAEGENAAWPAARDKAALVASADGSKVVLLGGFGPKESEYGDDLPEDDEFDGDDDDGECCEQK